MHAADLLGPYTALGGCIDWSGGSFEDVDSRGRKTSRVVISGACAKSWDAGKLVGVIERSEEGPGHGLEWHYAGSVVK